MRRELLCSNSRRNTEPQTFFFFYSAVFGVSKDLGVAEELLEKQNWTVGNARP